MSYSGAGPTGQAFGYPGQNGEQMYGDQSGFQQFHQQPFQQQQQPSPSMGMQQQQQRGSFSGGMNQAQFFQNQPAYQGQYGQPQQYTQHQQQQPSPYQQHQQIPQQRQSPQIQQQPQQQHNQMQFNGMQSYQQFQPQGYAQPMQPAANQYTPPSNVWQQQVQQQMHPMPSQQLHQMQNHSMQQQQHHQNQHQPSPTPPPPTHQQLQHQQPHLQQQQAQRVFYQSASPSPQLQQRQSHSPAPRTPSFTNLQQLQHARPHAPSPPQPQARVMHQSPQPQQIARRPSQPQVKLEPQPSPQQRPKPKIPQQPHRRPSQPKQQPQPSPQPHHQSQPSPQVPHQPPPPPPPQPEPESQIQLPVQHQRPPQEHEELPPPPPQIPTPTHIDPSQLRHQSEDNDERLLHDQLQQEQFSFVNLQDIQNLPPPPSLSMDNSFSIDPRDLSLPNTSIELQPALDIKPMKEEPDVGMMNAPPAPDHTAMAAPKSDTQRIKTEQQNASFTKSPSITARSPSISSITKRSPSMTPKPRPVNTIPIMAAIAEECLTKARKSAHDVAMSSDESALDEYQALVTTSLSCYEAILRDKTLSPREEAMTRLRYATVVQEETENWMEAETALTKGVTLCDKHRLLDLKYCMQYAMLKVLFQRNHKAALKAADGHISDCEAYRHVHWYYAFRLLKAQFYNEMSRESDSHGADRGALENLRAIQKIAEVRGDHAMTILASLLEGLILLKSDKDEKQPEKVQSCLAQAAKFQLDDSVQIIQLQVLYHILDFASSLNIDAPDGTAQKLRQLQKSVDDCDSWGSVNADFRVPVKKQSSSSKTISADTAGIIVAGEEQSPNDFVTMTFMTKMELRALVFTFSGLAAMHKPSQGTKTPDLLKEAVKILETWDAATQGTSYGPPLPLALAMKQRSWRTDGQVYLCSVLALLAASHCHWKTAREYMDKILELISPETPPGLRLLSYYLAGAYLQGTGQLPDAMEIFQSQCFALDSTNGACFQAGFGEVALLAGLNRLWIMQHQSCRNDYETTELLEELSSHCNNHWNKDLRTAWHNVVAALVTDPPQQLNQQKVHIHAAMGGSRETSNVLGAAITLCIMRSRFFENVIGEQALKSARAASKQAQRSGNMLWQSVADGMLADSYEVQSQRNESQQELEKATAEAKRAFTHDT